MNDLFKVCGKRNLQMSSYIHPTQSTSTYFRNGTSNIDSLDSIYKQLVLNTDTEEESLEKTQKQEEPLSLNLSSVHKMLSSFRSSEAETSSNINAQGNNVSIETPTKKSGIPPILDEIMNDKALYNKKPNGGILEKYLPHKRYLKQNDPKGLKRYNALVKLLETKADFLIAEGSFDASTTSKDIKKFKPLDKFSKDLLASTIVETLLNRGDLIKKVLDSPQKFKFVIFQDNEIGKVAGKHMDNMIFLDDLHFLGGVVRPDDQYNPALHEFMHAVDGDSKKDRPDGVYNQMSKEQKKEFENETNELFEKHKQGIETGITKYAFSSKVEFLATIMETFYERPDAIKESSPNLYKLLADFFKFDPMVQYA